MYTHSLLYTFDAYTQTGVTVTTKLSDHWLLQIGLSPGNDVAPWVVKDRKLTLNTCLRIYTGAPASIISHACANSVWRRRKVCL